MSAPDYARYKPEDFSCARGGVHRCGNSVRLRFWPIPAGMTPAATRRPAYHPSTLLKIYLYGYLNRLQSSRRLERETQRKVELMWLTGRLSPDFKTIADFRKDKWGSHPGDVPSVHRSLSPAGPVRPDGCCH